VFLEIVSVQERTAHWTKKITRPGKQE